jgi:hypothetical protein
VGRSISPKHQQSHRDGVVALVTRIIPLVTAFASRTGCARTEMRNRLQVNSRGQCLAKYNYRDIDAICLVSDYPGGFVVMLVNLTWGANVAAAPTLATPFVLSSCGFFAAAGRCEGCWVSGRVDLQPKWLVERRLRFPAAAALVRQRRRG